MLIIIGGLFLGASRSFLITALSQVLIVAEERPLPLPPVSDFPTAAILTAFEPYLDYDPDIVLSDIVPWQKSDQDSVNQGRQFPARYGHDWLDPTAKS